MTPHTSYTIPHCPHILTCRVRTRMWRVLSLRVHRSGRSAVWDQELAWEESHLDPMGLEQPQPLHSTGLGRALRFLSLKAQEESAGEAPESAVQNREPTVAVAPVAES